MAAPNVRNLTKRTLTNTRIAASELFRINERNSDEIVSYRFTDLTGTSGSGFFQLAGVARSQGATFTITAAELSQLVFVGGSQPGVDSFEVQATNASDETSLMRPAGLILTTRERNDVAPIARGRDFSVLANESISLERFISASDPDGFPIRRFRIRDRSNDQGRLTFQGVDVPQGEFVSVKPSELSELRYVAVGRSSTEQLQIQASDGRASEFATLTVRITPNLNRPIVQFSNIVVFAAERFVIGDQAVARDDDGNTIKFFEFRNPSPHASFGELVLDGVVQPRRTWIRVEQDELTSLIYQAPDRQLNSHRIFVRAFDGRSRGPASVISVRTNARPELETDGLVVDSQLQALAATDLFRQADVGNPYVGYEIFDGSFADSQNAVFEVNQNPTVGGQIISVTAEDFADNVQVRTGEFLDRNVDDLFVRADNGSAFSRWSRLRVRTEPDYLAAFEAGTTWTDFFEVPIDNQGRLELSYSFMQTFPDYNTGEAIDGDPELDEDFRPLSPGQRASIRRALDSVESTINVNFVEISDTNANAFSNGFDSQLGGIYRFGEYGLADSGAQAFAFLPNGSPAGGDVWFNRLNIEDPTLAFGGPSHTTVLHELMHTLGFRHVFEGVTLPESTKTDYFSVLSTFDGLRDDGLFPTSLQLYDIAVAQSLYGVNSQFNIEDTVYDLDGYFSDRADIFAESLWDAGGEDTLSAVGAGESIVDIEEGAFSSIGGDRNISIAFGAVIENATGSSFDDRLFGNAEDNLIRGGNGNDVIEGRAGNDFINGGAGNDRYLFGIGDGDDIISEQGLGGRDTIELTRFPTLDRLEDDVRFRLLENDLVIDLALEGGLVDASIRVTNQQFAASAIETLNFAGIEIDLKALSNQVTVDVNRFAIAPGDGEFGRLVTPIV